MPEYVEVAVNVPGVSGVYDYHLPPELEGRTTPGQLVEVPFGHQQVQGVLLRQVPFPQVAETKAVTGLLSTDISLLPHQITLAKEIAEQTLAPLSVCISLMLPAGISQLADTIYTLSDPPPTKNELNTTEAQLAAVLEKRGSLRGRQIDKALPRRNWRRAANAMKRKGQLTTEPILPPPRVRPRYLRTAQLAVPPELVRAGMQGLSRKQEVQERRQHILDFLSRESSLVDVSWVYAESGGNLADLKALNKKELVILREQEHWRDPLAGLAYDPAAPPKLTKNQQTVWEQIEIVLAKAREGGANLPQPPILLHGVTGSGKTELYLRAVAETIKAGKQAIVLVPEIALTPQTVRRFMARFPGRVGLVHSQLSPGEQYDTWRRARRGKLSVIVGPRSALFSPLPDLGLIILDESHDDSYYQSNLAPYYHARQAAIMLAKLVGGVCLFGSATPDVTSYHQAKRGRWQYLNLPARILAHVDTVRSYQANQQDAHKYQPDGDQTMMTDLPAVEVVDMREELKAGNSSIFSREMQQALKNVLNKEQQAILFLNRRGSATYVFCRDCGHTMACPRCDTNLTYYLTAGRSPQKLSCNRCGYSRNMPKTCPQCGSDRFRHYGMGTERVESELLKILPDARTLRWDYETTRQKGAHDLILSHFTNHNADILIGTQMLAKGLDLPRVTLVGVVLADVGLHLPDYRAGERVFQVLAQVAGRAGRSPLGGRVVLQTFNPESYVIQHAAQHDYKNFAAQELGYREQLRFPPYTRLVRMVIRNRNASAAENEAKRMAGYLKALIQDQRRRATDIIGPAPCFYARQDGYYRWQIILRGPDPASMLTDEPLGDWRVEVEPQSLL